MLIQVTAILRWTLASLGSRGFSSFVLVASTAAMVLVFLALLAMTEGLASTIARGAPDRALILGAGSNSEINGTISREQLQILRSLPGIASDAHGEPLISGEIYASVNLPVDPGGYTGVAVRGVDVPDALRVRPEARVASGRAPRSGHFELLVGEQIARRIPGLRPGSQVDLRGQRWTVSGSLASRGESASEIWIDVDVMANVWRRGEFLQSALVRLPSPEHLETLQDALRDPRLNHHAWRESSFRGDKAERATAALRLTTTVAGVIMALGVVFAALNTLLSTIDARRREIAVLRALGFAPAAIAVSVIGEGMMLSALGALSGIGAARTLFHGAEAQATGSSLTEVVYAMQVTPGAVALAFAAALTIGFAGSLLPALAAVRGRIDRDIALA